MPYSPLKSTFIAAEKIEAFIYYACDLIIISQLFIALGTNMTHQQDSLVSRFLSLEVVDMCAIKRVPFFLALLAAEQMNAFLIVDNLIEASQKKYFLTL